MIKLRTPNNVILNYNDKRQLADLLKIRIFYRMKENSASEEYGLVTQSKKEVISDMAKIKRVDFRSKEQAKKEVNAIIAKYNVGELV